MLCIQVSLHGGQVLSWKTHWGEELLFTSSKVFGKMNHFLPFYHVLLSVLASHGNDILELLWDYQRMDYSWIIGKLAESSSRMWNESILLSVLAMVMKFWKMLWDSQRMNYSWIIGKCWIIFKNVEWEQTTTCLAFLAPKLIFVSELSRCLIIPNFPIFLWY